MIIVPTLCIFNFFTIMYVLNHTFTNNTTKTAYQKLRLRYLQYKIIIYWLEQNVLLDTITLIGQIYLDHFLKSFSFFFFGNNW